jgi:hypothetical protein
VRAYAAAAWPCPLRARCGFFQGGNSHRSLPKQSIPSAPPRRSRQVALPKECCPIPPITRANHPTLIPSAGVDFGSKTDVTSLPAPRSGRKVRSRLRVVSSAMGNFRLRAISTHAARRELRSLQLALVSSPSLHEPANKGRPNEAIFYVRHG